MAEEALKKAGEKLGVSIKVETNGSGGAKNILTKEEIEHCKGIIVAADVNVEIDVPAINNYTDEDSSNIDIKQLEDDRNSSTGNI